MAIESETTPPPLPTPPPAAADGSATQNAPPEGWVFASAAVARARQVARLQRDFEVNLDAAALMADLMQEVRELRLQLRGF